MSQIFISYSHEDAAIANRLANDLLDKNYSVWIDNLNLAGGVDWEKSIMQAIDDCSHFLILWSSNIEGSSYSQKEKDRAMLGNKTVIPLFVSGDASRMWSDIQSIQYIDMSDYRSGFNKLIEQVVLPSGILAAPEIYKLIKQGDMTFNSAQRLFRSQFDYGNASDDAVALLIERSNYGIQTFLVGKRSQKIEAASAIQVFMNFSGNIDTDRFADFLAYANIVHPQLFTVLVRGAIQTTSRGLQYYLPNDAKVWQEAIHQAWAAIGKIGIESLPIHLYMNAPVAMGAGFCASKHFRRELTIYHVNFAPDPKHPEDRYFPVYHFKHH